jgi:uncharacterized protein (TIGR03118 family)
MRERLNRVGVALIVAALLAVFSMVAAFAAGAKATSDNSYVVRNLVSDQNGVAERTDPNLVNAWGLTSLPTSPWWVADNGTDVSTIYRADGSTARPPVNVASAPTGAAANTGPGFVVSEGANSGPAVFLFATEEGKILGWNPNVDASNAVVGANRSNVDAIYKGLVLSGNTLYATDFHNARVDVFNSSFGLVNDPGAFVDPKIPNGFAPFGIAAIDGKIFVSYAKQDADREDDVAGQGLGYVDAYSSTGTLLQRIVNRGQLNSPWGMAMAPAGFGAFGGDLLVGNFGDGEINAYQPQATGTFERVGALKSSSTGKEILIDGLWALAFGKGTANNGPTDTLFFTAGPDDENHGLFGTIRAG